MNEELTRFRCVAPGTRRFTLGDNTEHTIQEGSIVSLPASNVYVRGLIKRGILIEANEAPDKPAAENATPTGNATKRKRS